MFALVAPGSVTETEPNNVQRLLVDQAAAATAMRTRFAELLDKWMPGTPLPAGVRLVAHDVDHYDGEAFTGRDALEVGPYGALVRSESLTFTDKRLAQAFDGAVPTYLRGREPLPAGAPSGFGADLGYRRQRRSSLGYHDGWYCDTLCCAFDVHDAGPAGRGLMVATRDALGNESQLRHDSYGLFGVAATDSAGLTTDARFDYRALQPAELTEPNGNRMSFAFTALGLLAASSVQGRPRSSEGDQARAGVDFTYDMRAFHERGGPVSTPTRRHAHHDTETDVPLERRDHVLETVEYSDGFGRLVQTRTLAEDLIFDDPDLAAPLFGDAGLSRPGRFAPPSAGPTTCARR